MVSSQSVVDLVSLVGLLHQVQLVQEHPLHWPNVNSLKESLALASAINIAKSSAVIDGFSD